MLPGQSYPECESARERLGAFRVRNYGNINPEEHQEDLPLQRRRHEAEEKEEKEGSRERGRKGQPADHR